jgi:hypothetical protein
MEYNIRLETVYGIIYRVMVSNIANEVLDIVAVLNLQLLLFQLASAEYGNSSIGEVIVYVL